MSDNVKLRSQLRRIDHPGGKIAASFVEKVAKSICNAQGDFDWEGLRDVEGNPSTAWAYEQYLKIARKVIKDLRLRPPQGGPR